MSNLRNYSCDICKISCNSAEQLRIHKSSKTHFKKCANAGVISIPVDTNCYDPMQQSPGSQSSEGNCCPLCLKKMEAAEILTHHCEPGEYDFPLSPQPPQNFTFADVSTPTPGFEFYCSTCNISLCSPLNYQAHVKGKRHLDRKNQELMVQAKGRDSCDGYDGVLSNSFDGLQIGYGGRVLVSPSFPPSTPQPTVFDPNITLTGGGYYCNVCNLTLNSTPQMSDHIAGRKHKSRASMPMGSLSVNVTNNSSLLSPIAKPNTNPIVPVNSTICPVCEVPVGNTEMKHHADGKVHLYKSALLNLDRICDSNLPEPPRVRLFSSSFPSVYNNFSSKLNLVQPRLLQVSRSDGDVIFRLNTSEAALISVTALVVAFALVRENRKFNQNTFAAWICPQKAAIPMRTAEVRSLAQNIIVDPPRLANILKDTFSQDDKNRDLTEHDIAFTTPGGLDNLMRASANVERALCALILTDVEHCVDHDPTDALLSRFAAFEYSKRPRIVFITTGLPPNWPIFEKFVIM